jgi:hypothetical protein
MTEVLQDQIIETYKKSLSLYQSFSIIHHDKTVDLSHACGTADFSTLCAPDQPKKLPYGIIYCFDTTFSGKYSWSPLKKNDQKLSSWI